MSHKSEYVQLGQISGVHGIKGWVKIFSYTSPRLKITTYPEWFIGEKDNWKAIRVLEGKQQGKNIIALLENVNSRNQAEGLVGKQIAILTDQLETLPENHFYWRDLIGLTVVTTEGVELGKIDWIFDAGSNDVIVVKESDENKERMLPFLMNDVIKSVDLDESLVIADWDPQF